MGVKYFPKLRMMDDGGGIPYYLARPEPATPTVSSSTADQIKAVFASMGIDSIDGSNSSQGTSGSQGTSSSATTVLPPVLELLQEMRARRDSLAQRQQLISGILGGNVPRGQKNYLGYEPGGIADVLMGLITGEGPSAGARILPADQRAVRRQRLPVPGGEPAVGEESGGAMGLAQQILDALRVIGTGASQQSSSSQQSSGSTSAPAPAAAAPSVSPAPAGFRPRI